MNVIAYMRVSTDEQGDSRLGLEAQRAVLVEYAARQGYRILWEYEEVASAKGHTLANRPVLDAAINEARNAGATVLVAKLDRLSRDVAFISGLMAHRVPFEVAELGPEVDPFMLHIHASVAEQERQLISRRTRAALEAKRQRGEQVGNVENLGDAYLKGAARNRERAVGRAQGLREAMELVSGYSFREAARKLNALRIPTPSGSGQWGHKNVSRTMRRLEMV